MRAGTGHLEQIGKSWFLRYWTDPSGRPARTKTGRKRRQRRVRLGSAAEIRSHAGARSAADLWLRSQRPQSLQPGPGIRAGEYFAHYLATHVPLMRPASQRRYRSAVRAHLGPAFGQLGLEYVDARRIQAWIATAAPKLARESVKGLRAILLQMLRQVIADGFSAHRIDARTIRLPKVTRAPRERREVGDGELRKLLEASEQPWRLLWALMGFAGLRIGEALGLDWAHVDLEHRVVKVRQAAVLGRLQPTKTETSKADIPILPELDLEFRAHIAGLPDTFGPETSGLVFASKVGTPLRSDNVRARVLQPLLERVGVRHCGLHAFRHGLPGRLLAFGASPDVVQRVMRHGSLRQTETYLHSGNLDLHAALDSARNRGRREGASVL